MQDSQIKNASGWTTSVSKSNSESRGKVYYCNTKTKQTQWDRPPCDVCQGVGKTGNVERTTKELADDLAINMDFKAGDPITALHDRKFTLDILVSCYDSYGTRKPERTKKMLEADIKAINRLLRRIAKNGETKALPEYARRKIERREEREKLTDEEYWQRHVETERREKEEEIAWREKCRRDEEEFGKGYYSPTDDD